MQASGFNQIVDVCSGSSGPIVSILESFSANQKDFDFNITLTDKYPNLDRFNKVKKLSQGKIEFVAESVDALNFPDNLKGVRTFFSCLHHFRPQEAEQIIRATIDDGMPICVFEFTERSIGNFFKVLFLGFLLVWLNTPFIRPFRFDRLFWTYIVPVVPFFYCWDALVSHIRTYTTEEIQQMLDKIEKSQNYKIEIGQVYSPKARFNITYFMGYTN